jgi:murein L,D-transpeptidase YafK
MLGMVNTGSTAAGGHRRSRSLAVKVTVIVLGAAAGVAAALVWANRPVAPMPPGFTADRVVVLKAEREMRLYRDGQVGRVFRISLGANPVGHKMREGDERTPEGVYVLDWSNADSIAFLSMHVSYPNADDLARARSRGVDPGGMIMVHGIRNGLGWIGRFHRLVDWTDGCIAVTNPEMRQFWDSVPVGTPIEIRP